MKKSLLVALACLSLLVFVVRQADSKPILGDPMKPKHNFLNTSTWEVASEPGGRPVRGKLTVTCYADDKDEIKLSMSGLAPNAVHTVWLATSLKETAVRGGVGTAPYQYKSTGGGNLGLVCLLEKCPLTEWKWLEVRMHPDGDPTHIQESVRVARVRLLAE